MRCEILSLGFPYNFLLYLLCSCVRTHTHTLTQQPFDSFCYWANAQLFFHNALQTFEYMIHNNVIPALYLTQIVAGTQREKTEWKNLRLNTLCHTLTEICRLQMRFSVHFVVKRYVCVIVCDGEKKISTVGNGEKKNQTEAKEERKSTIVPPIKGVGNSNRNTHTHTRVCRKCHWDHSKRKTNHFSTIQMKIGAAVTILAVKWFTFYSI